MNTNGFRIILSRKGFDSSSGGGPSPILPDGRMISLPIPYAPGSRVAYADIAMGSGPETMGGLVEDLSNGRTQRDALAHLDPDLDSHAIARASGWLPAFGQCEASQTHLVNRGVGAGDVFLFHGWFRAVSRLPDGRWRFVAGAPDLSVIYGWLQIGEVIDLERTTPAEAAECRPWLRGHPHLHFPDDVRLVPPRNAIYVAAERLKLPGCEIDAAGAGVFRTVDPRRVLTAPGKSRSVWRLPRWFRGDDVRPWLTQFPNLAWWADLDADFVLLTPRGRQGQEAVLDCRNRPDAGPWVASLFGEMAERT